MASDMESSMASIQNIQRDSAPASASTRANAHEKSDSPRVLQPSYSRPSDPHGPFQDTANAAKDKASELATNSLLQCFVSCGFCSGEHQEAKSSMGFDDVLCHLVSVPRLVIESLSQPSTSPSALVLQLGLEHQFDLFMQEFTRIFTWRGAHMMDFISRREKVASRLWQAKEELDELDRQAKVQVGLSVSVKVMIRDLLSDLQKSTSYTERCRSKMKSLLIARGEDEKSFFQSLDSDSKALLTAHQEALFCQANLRNSITKFEFDGWIQNIHQQRQQEKDLTRRQSAKGESSIIFAPKSLSDHVFEVMMFFLHKVR